MSLAYAAARALLKPALDRQIRIRAEGLRNIPASGPALLVCNHRSVVDPLVLASSGPREMHFVAATWMGSVPGLREFLAAMGTLVLPPAGRTEALVRLGRRQLRRGDLIAIFPEGEPPTLLRQAPDDLLPFHPGAAHLILGAGLPDLPVIPAALVPGPERVALRLPAGWLRRLEPGNPLYRADAIEVMAYEAVTVRFGAAIVFDVPPGLSAPARGRAASRIISRLESAVRDLLRG